MMKFKRSIQMRNKKISRILGIDPGYGRLGIAIIESKNKKPKLIHSECLETSAKLEHSMRLGLVLKKIKEIIKKFKPNKLAVETLIFSKNVKTALKVAEVRGVIIAEAANKGVEIFEYHPNSIKIAITGYGKSDKKQIIFMLEKILGLKKKFKHDDEYDAIAVALTCEASQNYPHN